MVSHQDEDDIVVSNDDDSIIDWLICERNQVRVKVNTMIAIENLQITSADLPDNLLSHLPTRDNSVVLSLTSSSDKVTNKHRVEEINQQ